MERPGLGLLTYLFAMHAGAGLSADIGWGHIGHTAGFGAGKGASRYHRQTGRTRQRRAKARAHRRNH